ncbi:hypothetical protein FACS1894151_09430 [Spirochaetia bacterium]|nr:hypothetical protein FACS1894151_09430 [Spirochaetia bacterium]
MEFENQNPNDLTGLSPEAAKEYIAAHITTQKLTEKKLVEINGEIDLWESRLNLARSKDALDLVTEIEAQLNNLRSVQAKLGMEITELAEQIQTMRRQLPGLAARQRSVDPDLLEQELAIMLGRIPGDDTPPASSTGRKFNEMEADAALAALKAKMNGR